MSDEQIPPGDSEPGSGREPKVIKRYTNRKLYDTEESRYVTLEEIAGMIKAGAEVRVLDNRTKEDLTSVTLAQIIFEEEKKTSKVGLRMLRELVRHGSDRAQQFVEETRDELRGKVEQVRQAAEQRVQTLLSKGQQTQDRARELVVSSQEAVNQFQRKVDERVRTAVEGMSSLSDLRREIAELQARLGEMERKLAELEKKP
ncbi:polyhydroxyalkanoate synthesis regulator DNA-binding domain-containing protein [Anaeromyxobacter paludicola]|uniref:Polyhydroxyalkanoate synthesis repressor PhaR n=1 Tax=Anaeromyxobacter paludicola TaxID=2918171 RepID=A0ABM7X998_9BACT|nr:polyhydroxyalkanoate synthesis regulator DNA-binding domain-containing protein [Anaeromyxobacter paludicola]BDG08424.1 polyhydroxyalkanoate synthesis repressor PhaR [Anaeromyxobacter paludicola]